MKYNFSSDSCIGEHRFIHFGVKFESPGKQPESEKKTEGEKVDSSQAVQKNARERQERSRATVEAQKERTDIVKNTIGKIQNNDIDLSQFKKGELKAGDVIVTLKGDKPFVVKKEGDWYVRRAPGGLGRTTEFAKLSHIKIGYADSDPKVYEITDADVAKVDGQKSKPENAKETKEQMRSQWLKNTEKELKIKPGSLKLGEPNVLVRAPVEQHGVYLNGKIIGNIAAGFNPDTGKTDKDESKYDFKNPPNVDFLENGFKNQISDLVKATER